MSSFTVITPSHNSTLCLCLCLRLCFECFAIFIFICLHLCLCIVFVSVFVFVENVDGAVGCVVCSRSGGRLWMLGSLPDRFSHTVFPPTFYQPFSAPNFANFPHLINIHKSILYQCFPTSFPTPLVLPLFLFFSQPALQPNMFVVSDSNPFTHFVVLL